MNRASLQPVTSSQMETSGDPFHHTQKLKAQMHQLIEHLRKDVGQVAEPKAQALFETSAEVLIGLVKAFDDYEQQSEAAWQTEVTVSHPDERTTDALTR